MYFKVNPSYDKSAACMPGGVGYFDDRLVDVFLLIGLLFGTLLRALPVCATCVYF